MKLKTLNYFNFGGKRVLLRVDVNSEVIKGKVFLNDRIIESAKTISELKKKEAKVVVLAHQGRPGDKDFVSLRQHAQLLNKYVKIRFVNNVLGREAVSEIINLKNEEALLLENVRTLNEEFEPDKKNDLVRILAPLFDIYVNDAFSVSHRAQTSIVSFPRILPSCVGRTFEKELKSLEKLKIKNALFILGGAKVEDLVPLINQKRKILTSGIPALLFLKIKGYKFGAHEKYLKKYYTLLHGLKKYSKKIKTPVDFAINLNGKRKELILEEFPSKYEVYDIGSKTIKLYKKEIKKAKSILMKGPAGICETREFCKGTDKLLNEIANSKAFSVIAGGHTISAMERLKINKNRFDYVSLSGGALVEYLAGKKLPGLEVLKEGREYVKR